MLTKRRQNGAALFVSLIILLVLSIIGVSAVRGGLLQSLMSANAQQSEMTFSVADAGAGATLNAIRQQQVAAAGLVNTAMMGGNTTVFIDNTGALSAAAVNFDSDQPNPIMSVTTTTNYLDSCQVMLCPGMDLSGAGGACHQFSVNSTGTVSDTNANVTLWVSVIAAGASGSAPCT